MLSEPRRLHPVAGIVNFLKQLKEMLFPVVLFIIFGGRGEDPFWQLLYFVGTGLLIIGLLVIGILQWYRYTYRIESDELRIEYGIFIRKKRFIPLERVQSIDISAGIIQRMFGLVKLQVETAGGGNTAEAVLTAITVSEAEQLKNELSKKPKDAEVVDEGVRESIEITKGYQISTTELFIAAVTSGSIGVVLSAVGALAVQVDELIPYETIFRQFEDFVRIGVFFYVILIFSIVLLAWVIGTVITVLKYGNFSVAKQGEDLIITRGILEKRQLTIPLKRIQAIRIQESLIRQPLGYATVFVESAGGSVDKNEGHSTILFPLVKKDKINTLLSKLVHDYTLPTDFNKAPKRAVIRYLIRSTLPVLVIIVPAIIFLPVWSYLSLILLPLAILLGYWRYQDAGWKYDDYQLQLRFRLFSKTTVLLRRSRIQSVMKRQSLFQTRNKLGSYVTSVKSAMGGKDFKIVDFEESDCEDMLEWYTKRRSE
ncbi:PH domain-containing protein [Bacillus luteolus]|uniref:PH domain-containing protein n=1 Tax=Litchfieldia luteola TaxID=682179 RepID=A0ABR9QMF3_9BACI|nr:PH domain-containing protein [Cytobacillus luteolus]MBE4909672.1 PH domain-containing protein [Cytobacillus luteolus]MBP1944574.1 putative membrane protein [Cytobacillus luteolus]